MAILDTPQTPIFVQNQVLRADDLNNMVAYFENQARLTRIFTIGIGILRGLTIDSFVYGSSSFLDLEPGIGISSDGILFQFDVMTRYTHFKKTNLSRKAINCDENNQRGSCNDDEDRIDADVYEMLKNDDEEGAKPILELPTGLEGYCLVLIHCEEPVNRKSCFNECEKNGADLNTQVRLMAIPGSEISNNDQGGTNNVSKVDLDNPNCIERLGNMDNAIDLCGIETWDLLYNNYRTKCLEVLNAINENFQSAFDEFYFKLNSNNTNAFGTLLNELNLLVNSYPINSPELSDIQYLYAYLRDLTLAYDEFFKEACGISIGINISADSDDFDLRCAFPGYVALGTLGSGEGIVDCRTGFFPASASEGGNERQDRAEILYHRLEDLVQTISIAGTPNGRLDVRLGTNELINSNQLIRITGSCTQKFSLSRQAAGYYLRLNNVRSHWSAVNPYCNDLPQFVTHYDLSELNDAESNILIKKFDVFDFYRIEGHLGHPLQDAIQLIERNRKDLNLPFDVRPLLIGPDVSLEPALLEELELYIGETQEVYQNTRSDVICKIEEFDPNGGTGNLNVFYNTLVTFNQLGDIDGVTFKGQLNAAISQNADPVLTAVLQNAQPIFENLLDKYAKALEEIRKAMTFHGFAETNPGMEHLGGVHSGGTFIVVYANRLTNRDFLANSGIPNLGNLSDEQVLELLVNSQEPPVAIDTIMANIQKVVVADFCLPYSCCSNSPVIRNEIRQPDLQIISDGKICWEPDAQITRPFTVTPEGGTIRFYLNGVLDQNNVISNAMMNQQLDVSGLISSAAEFTNGKAEIKIEYTLGSQTEEKIIEVYKKPNTLFTLTNVEKIVENCRLVGFTATFTHSLTPNDFDPAAINPAQWNFGNGTMNVDLSSDTAIREYRFIDEFLVLPIDVELRAVNDICQNDHEIPVDFCPNTFDITLCEGCELISEEIFDDQGNSILSLVNITCDTPIEETAPNEYTFKQGEGSGYFQIKTDCPGGRIRLELVDGSDAENKALLEYLISPLSDSTDDCLNSIHLFIYDKKKIDEDDGDDNITQRLLNIENLVPFEVTQEIKIMLTYSLAGAGPFTNDCNPERSITIIIQPSDSSPGFTEAEPPEGNNTETATPDVTPGTVVSSGPNVRAASKKKAKAQANKPAKKEEAKKTTTKKAVPKKDNAKKAVVKKEASKKEVPPPAKPKIEKPTKKPVAAKKTAPPSKKAMDLLNTRSAANRKAIDAMEKDKNLARTKPFQMTKSFLILPATNISIVNTRFEEVAETLTRSLSSAKGKRATDLNKVASILLQNYLDKQTVLSPNSINEATKNILENRLEKLKDKKIKLASIAKVWNGPDLKKALKAKVVDVFLKLLK